MVKSHSHRTSAHTAETGRRLRKLRGERRRLASQLAKIDSQLEEAALKKRRPLSVAELDRLLDKLSEGLDSLPPLPRDFSRGDLYDDHD